MLLRGVALAGVAASGAAGSFAPARAEIWEEGDEQCVDLGAGKVLAQRCATAGDVHGR